MQFSTCKIWTTDRLDLQRKIHNSIYYHNNRVEWRGRDGRSRGGEKTPKQNPNVFCDDKRRNGHVILGLTFQFVSELKSFNQDHSWNCQSDKNDIFHIKRTKYHFYKQLFLLSCFYTLKGISIFNS